MYGHCKNSLSLNPTPFTFNESLIIKIDTLETPLSGVSFELEKKS